MVNKLTAKAEEELVAKIVEAVPEIMFFYCPACRRKHEASKVGYCDCTYFLDIRNIEQSPITLEDVLRASEYYYEQGTEEDRDRMDEAMGTVGLYMLDDIRMEIVNDWHLGKTLSEQSDETKLFLHSLLCSK